jgi:hypothetical protein
LALCLPLGFLLRLFSIEKPMLPVEDLRTLRKTRKHNAEVAGLLLTYENWNSSTVRVLEVRCRDEEILIVSHENLQKRKNIG